MACGNEGIFGHAFRRIRGNCPQHGNIKSKASGSSWSPHLCGRGTKRVRGDCGACGLISDSLRGNDEVAFDVVGFYFGRSSPRLAAPSTAGRGGIAARTRARQGCRCLLDRPGMACLKPTSASAGTLNRASIADSAQTPGVFFGYFLELLPKVTRRRRKTSSRRQEGSRHARKRTLRSFRGCEARSFAALRMTRGEVGAGPSDGRWRNALGPLRRPLRGHSGRTEVWCWSGRKAPLTPDPLPTSWGEGERASSKDRESCTACESLRSLATPHPKA